MTQNKTLKSLAFSLFAIILTIVMLSLSVLVSGLSIEVNNTIQESIDDASSGDTIVIPSGNFTENLIINKSINLIGNGTNTIIKSNSTSNDASDILNRSAIISIYSPEGINNTIFVTIINLTIDGLGSNKTNGVLFFASNGSLENIKILGMAEENITAISKKRVSVYITHLLDHWLPQYVEIKNSILEDYQTSGIVAAEIGTNVLIENSTFKGLGNQSYMKQYGIQINYGATGIIRNNIITNHFFVPLFYNVSVGEASAIMTFGNNVYANFTNSTINISEVLIENNVIENNSYGIFIDGDNNYSSGNVKAIRNTIRNNLAGIFLGNASVNLTYNYWGTTSPNFTSLVLGQGNITIEPFFKDVDKLHLSNEVILPPLPSSSGGGQSSGGGSSFPLIRKNDSNMINATTPIQEEAKSEENIQELEGQMKMQEPKKKNYIFWSLFFIVCGGLLMFSLYKWYKDEKNFKATEQIKTEDKI